MFKHSKTPLGAPKSPETRALAQAMKVYTMFSESQLCDNNFTRSLHALSLFQVEAANHQGLGLVDFDSDQRPKRTSAAAVQKALDVQKTSKMLTVQNRPFLTEMGRFLVYAK